jgi:hypothetical protein|nr:MAG TPA: hypothetical protein [Caudoviricetes sp.]
MHATVKVIDLWAAANLMKSDKMKYVSVSIDEDGFISFTAMKDLDDIEAIDYDPVEPIAGNPLL